MSANNLTRAACLTAPGAAGIAVVQVWGPAALHVVSPHLRSFRDSSHSILDLCKTELNHIRLCRIVDGEEIIDEALVCVRADDVDGCVVDLNVHGGPRVVQRVLAMLARQGAKIVSGLERAGRTWAARDGIEEEALGLLPFASTRAVATWLMQTKDELASRLRGCVRLIADGDADSAQACLAEMLARLDLVARLFEPARIVITGRPNAGKSTLVNALARHEHVLVSDVPGTTRDYVEQRAAIDGLPVLLVDTAGIRESADPLEREAIVRARRQIAAADLVLRVVDQSAPPEAENEDLSADDGAGTVRGPELLVWNKMDLPLHPARKCGEIDADSLCRISAATGDGTGQLEQAVLSRLGLTGWREQVPLAFTARQRRLIQAALDGLNVMPLLPERAIQSIRECIENPASSGDASASAWL